MKFILCGSKPILRGCPPPLIKNPEYAYVGDNTITLKLKLRIVKCFHRVYSVL